MSGKNKTPSSSPSPSKKNSKPTPTTSSSPSNSTKAYDRDPISTKKKGKNNNKENKSSFGKCFLFVFVVLPVIVAIGIGAGIYLDEHHPPTFDPKFLHSLARNAVAAGLSREEAFANITTELKHRYPGLISDLTPPIFINAGGFMGSFTLIHASLSEYILFFGSALGTTGHSGRYWGDIYDFLLTGEFWQWNEGTYTKRVYRPGDMIVHDKWAATAIRIDDGSWMLEYAQGVIPSMMPFAFSDSIFSTQDLATLGKSLKIYASLVIDSLSKGKI